MTSEPGTLQSHPCFGDRKHYVPPSRGQRGTGIVGGGFVHLPNVLVAHVVVVPPTCWAPAIRVDCAVAVACAIVKRVACLAILDHTVPAARVPRTHYVGLI
eukprot:2867080-Rhodomonas_salina.1